MGQKRIKRPTLGAKQFFNVYIPFVLLPQIPLMQIQDEMKGPPQSCAIDRLKCPSSCVGCEVSCKGLSPRTKLKIQSFADMGSVENRAEAELGGKVAERWLAVCRTLQKVIICLHISSPAIVRHHPSLVGS